MDAINNALAANRAAVSEFIVAAEAAAPHWTVPRAPGKWSPSQVVEHLARSFEESANLVAGVPSKFPTIPRLLRPPVRMLFFSRAVRTGKFPSGGRTAAAFNPASGPGSPPEGRARLEAAVDKFERACRARESDTATASSGVFGTVLVTDYVRFQELHARHHRKQLSPGA